MNWPVKRTIDIVGDLPGVRAVIPVPPADDLPEGDLTLVAG
jgi:hypothetical protein